jgi:hypothetical protein
VPEPDTYQDRPETSGSDAGVADEVRRGRQALARLAEAERELALVRHQQDAKVAELEERLGWFEENELDLRALAERHGWLRGALRVWSSSVRFARLVARRLSR